MRHSSDRAIRFTKEKIGHSLVIVVFAAVIVELISLLQYSRLRNLVMDGLGRQSMTELWSKTEIINHTLESAEATLQDHLWDLRRNLDNADSMLCATRRMIETNPDIVGGFITFIPDYYPEKGRLFEPYARKAGGKVKVSQIASPDHDYTLNPNYQKTLEEGRGFWTDPYRYVDENVSDLTTYSYPLMDSEGQTVGVCGIDIDLSWLGDTLNARHHYPSSFTLMLTEDGVLFAGPSDRHSKSGDIGQVVRILNDPAAARKRSESGRTAMIAFRDSLSHEKAFVYYSSRDQEPRWKVAQVVFEKELYGKIRKLRFLDSLLTLAALIALFLMIERFARNERKLRDAYVEHARIGNELGIARRIQEAMLPKTFPPYPDRRDIDIFGTLEPAKEVGGDLFDFFIRDEKLFFLIGDVSGKGIPAAIVMAMMHSLFSLASADSDDPVEIIKALNGEGCKNNEAGMFVTCFLGVLDLSTGQLHYCNAGHDRPLLVSDTVEELPAHANLPIGAFKDSEFEGQERLIAPGTTIFLYTDGLTEAKDTERRMFTKDRIVRILNGFASNPEMTPEKMLSSVGEKVHQFMEGAQQSDDLTMLAIRYKGAAWRDSITLRNDVQQIRELGRFMKSVSDQVKMEEGLARQIRLAVEEIVVNVMEYAYPEGEEGIITVEAVSDDRQLTFVVCDTGVAFAPTSVPEPDINLPAEERSPGGLGIFLARKLMDSVHYVRKDGKNILTLIKNIKPQEYGN